MLGAIGVLGGSVLAAGQAVAAVPTLAPTPTSSLIVNPSEGRADTQITVVYEVSVKVSSPSCPLAVVFSWDGGRWHTVARPRIGDCVFAFKAAPPDHTPGPHQIGARGLSSTYTILNAAPTATPTPTLPSPTPYRTTTGPTVPTQDVTDQPAAGVDTSQAAAAPLESGASVLGEAAQQSGGGGATAWILIFGGLLVLGGIAILGVLIYWGRRGGNDGGGMTSDTEVFGA